MSGDTAQRLYDLVARALEEPPERRRAWIEGACGGDAALRDRALRVVEADAALGEFLKTPAPSSFERLAPEGPPLPPGATVGRYRLLRAIGSGGSGAVYEALQESPHRKVAVKIMAAGLGSTGAVNRFREEAEILARMSHPGIAHVYEAGVHREDGLRLPWLAIEYVEGRDVVTHAKGLPLRGRLELMARVCDAVHHGHEQGILHGDLKPTNLLVDAQGRPKVIDFGIARVLGGDADGDIAGTPPYMSPEQCEPLGRLDVRSDVYALGAVLYEVLAGRRAHDVGDLPLAVALRAVREETPTPIGSIDFRLRGDVAAIVDKALSRDRVARYASAAALADDLRRHLGRRPIEARPHGLLYVAGRFARREPAVAVLAVLIVLLSVGAAAAGARLAFQKERQREAAERRAYVANLAAASAALRADDVAEARQQLQRAPEALRGWEWRHLEGRLDDSERTIALPGRSVYAGAVDAAGHCAAVSYSTRAEVTAHGVVGIDLATGAQRFAFETGQAAAYSMAMDPSGGRLALGYTDGTIELRDARTGEPLLDPLDHGSMVNGLAFDAEGTRLASAGRDRTVRVWDARTGARVASIEGHADRAICVAFDPRGELLASGGREGTVRIFDIARGTHVATLEGHGESIEDVAWSPDGRLLVSASRDRTVRLWDARLHTQFAVRHVHENNVSAVAFAPDGATFASISWDRTVRLWSVPDARPIACLRGHESTIHGGAFVHGGRIVTFGREIKVWRAEAREEVPALYGHGDVITSLAFARGGGRLASAARNGSLRVWDLERDVEVEAFEAHARRITAITVACDGTLVALADGALRTWTPAEGGYAGGGRGREVVATGACCVAASPKGPTVVVGLWAGQVTEVDLPTGRRGPAADVFQAPVAVLALDADGRIAAASTAGEIAVIDGRRVVARAQGAPVSVLAFSPDGTTLASAARDGRVLLRDARTLAVRASLEGHGAPVLSVAFHPDGTRLATGGEDATVRLWDPRTGEPLLVLHGPRYRVFAVAWSPDGRCLASAEGASEAADSCIRLWR